MPKFTLTLFIDASVETVFGFHEAPDAFERLTPDWAGVRILKKIPNIRAGARGVFSVPVLGPIRVEWHAVHTEFEKNRLFVDEQEKGPFAYWRHEHRFRSVGTGTELEDAIEFRLPGGPLVNWVGAPFAKWQLARLFAYRHKVTKEACESQGKS